MLNLIYNIKCGFKGLYITEEDLEEEIGCLFDRDCIAGLVEDVELPTEEEFYNLYKNDPKGLEEYLAECGVLGNIEEQTEIEYGHTYFKNICFKEGEEPFLPTCQKIYNLRLKYDPTVEVNFTETDDKLRYIKKSLKANEVMHILKISRPTLCHYVKKGLIEIDSNYTGKQYRYNAESVYKLLDGHKKH